jgi:hypothetical protein
MRIAEFGLRTSGGARPGLLHSALRIPRSAFPEGRQIEAGCTCPENRIGVSRGRSVTDAFRQFQTLNERKSHEIHHPFPKSVAPSPELQAKSNDPNPAREGQFCLSPGAFRVETRDHNV